MCSPSSQNCQSFGVFPSDVQEWGCPSLLVKDFSQIIVQHSQHCHRSCHLPPGKSWIFLELSPPSSFLLGNPEFSWSCHLPLDLAVEIGKGNPAKFSFDLGFDLGPGSPEVLIWWPCRIWGVWSLGKWLIKGMKPPRAGMCEFPQFCFAYFALIALPGVGGHKLSSRGWKMVIPVVNNGKKWNFEEEQSLENTMEAMLRRKGRAPKCQGEHNIF